MKDIIIGVIDGKTRQGRPNLNLSYTFGRGARLVCQDRDLQTTGNFMGISDVSFSIIDRYENTVENIIYEYRQKKFIAIVLDFEKRCVFREKFIKTLEIRLLRENIPLYVDEKYSDICKSAIIIVASNINDGVFEKHLENKLHKYGKIAIEIVPLSLDFPILGIKSQGRHISIDDIRKITAPDYISRELCAKYLTYMDNNGDGHFILFDDKASIIHKVNCIRKAGILDIFVLQCDEWLVF